MSKRIYWPATCSILTPGHIRCLRFLSKIGFVYVGLLTKKGLKGYKKEIVPFKDRKYVLDTVAEAIGNVCVVGQDSLNPYRNIKKYKCRALASGDGFEPVELEAIKKLSLQKIDIRFKGEKTKLFSSSKILCQKEYC